MMNKMCSSETRIRKSGLIIVLTKYHTTQKGLLESKGTKF